MSPRRLLIVSHARHYRLQGRVYAYGPYAREIELWADLFPEIKIAAPYCPGRPVGDCLPIARPNVELLPQRETGGVTWHAKLAQIVAVPELVWGLGRAMQQCDAVHVRCPGNLGLVGVILAPFFSRYLIAKYAGQWTGYPGEPWTFRLQRTLLRSPWWRGPVTVYCNGPRQARNVIPFFTSILTSEQVGRARRAAAVKRLHDPLRILFVGRLTVEKNLQVLLEAIALLKNRGIEMECTVLGDGPYRESLQTLTARHALEGCVSFRGAVSFEEVLDSYERSDVLVLASETEGWPKAITEAMAFGLVCIGADCGLVPHILGEARGFVVPPGDVTSLQVALHRVATAPEEYGAMRARATAWACQHSLESLREALRALLCSQWGVTLGTPPLPRELETAASL